MIADTMIGTYSWSSVKHAFHNGQLNHYGVRQTLELMISTIPLGILGLARSSKSRML